MSYDFAAPVDAKRLSFYFGASEESGRSLASEVSRKNERSRDSANEFTSLNDFSDEIIVLRFTFRKKDQRVK